MVELTVTATVEAMAAFGATRGLDGSGPVVAGVVVAAGEAGDVTPGVADDHRRDDGSDTVKIGEGCLGSCHRDGDTALEGSELTLEAAYIPAQVVRLLFAEVPGKAAGYEVREFGVQSAGRLGA